MSSAQARALPGPRLAMARYPWVLIGILWIVSFLNSADRSLLIAVMPQIRAAFALGPMQLALINSALYWTYAVAAFLFGRLGDTSRRSRVIIAGLVFWSAATVFVPLSTGFVMLLVLRGLVAVGEGTYYPTATALISDWHQPAMRSRALSVHQTAVFAGAGIGAFTAGVLGDLFGWRVPFVVFGALGLLVCVGLYKWLRDAPVSAVRAPAASGGKPLRTVLRSAPALFLCAVFFLATGVTWGVGVWAPTYVHDRLGLDLASSALYGSVTVNVAGFLFVPLGGWLADSLAKRTPIGRFYALAIGLSLAGALLLPLDFVHTARGVGLVLLASSAGKGLFDGCIYAAVHDVVPREARATAVGLLTMLGFFGAGLAPLFVARVSEVFGMAVGLASLAFFYFLAVGLLLATRRVTRREVGSIRLLEDAAAS